MCSLTAAFHLGLQAGKKYSLVYEQVIWAARAKHEKASRR